MRKFNAIFGKMTVRWTPRHCHVELKGSKWSEPYTIVARDKTSVIIRIGGPDGTQELSQIHFVGHDYYWVAVAGLLCEYFRRVQ
jgi:hypothetical protein